MKSCVCLDSTYGCVLDTLGLAALECQSAALVLETLRSNETLDLGGLGVGLATLLLGSHLTANDVLADLQMYVRTSSIRLL